MARVLLTTGKTYNRVEGLPSESGQVGLTLALGRLRTLGVTGLRVALPAPGLTLADGLSLFGIVHEAAETEAGKASMKTLRASTALHATG